MLNRRNMSQTKYILIILSMMTCLLSLIGCTSHTTIDLGDQYLSLPDGFTTEEKDSSTILFHESEQIGGISKYSLSGKTVSTISEAEEFLQSAQILDFENPEDAISLSSCLFSDWVAEIYSSNQYERHYLFFNEDFLYDLWIDKNVVSDEMEDILLNAIS